MKSPVNPRLADVMRSMEPEGPLPEFTWERVGIGDHGGPLDFVARDGDVAVGRIYQYEGSPIGKMWFWTMDAFGPNIDRSRAECSGTVETKDSAVRLVERAYNRCKAA